MRIGRAPKYCRLCGLEKPLVEAHIVPRCVLKPLFSPNGPLRVISKDMSKFPKRIPSGVYDTNLLCGTCDSSFSPFEDYVADILQIVVPEARSYKCEGYIQVETFSYEKLKLGLLSILWRMSITDKVEYDAVKIGQLSENKIRKMLWRRDPGCAESFSIVLLCLTDYIGARSSLGTGCNLFRDAVMWNLGLPSYVAVIKIGRDIDPHAFQSMIMKPNHPLLVACKSNKLEADWKDVIETIQQSASKARKNLSC